MTNTWILCSVYMDLTLKIFHMVVWLIRTFSNKGAQSNHPNLFRDYSNKERTKQLPPLIPHFFQVVALCFLCWNNCRIGRGGCFVLLCWKKCGLAKQPYGKFS